MLRVLWDFAVRCWRRLHIFCVRIRSPRRAPTVDRIVAFQAQSSQPKRGRFRRQLSVRAHDGSLSSNPDGTLSDLSPSFDFSIPETVFQTSPGPPIEKNATDAGLTPKNDPVGSRIQGASLLVREVSPMSLGKPSASSTSDSIRAADSSDRS